MHQTRSDVIEQINLELTSSFVRGYGINNESSLKIWEPGNI